MLDGGQKARPHTGARSVLLRIVRLLRHKHFLDYCLSINLETVQINARSDLLLRPAVFPIPVRRVLIAGQEEPIERFPSSDIPSPALQHRHSNGLRQNIVDPQAHAVQSTRICAPRPFADGEWNPRLRIEWIWKVLPQLQSGASRFAGLG